MKKISVYLYIVWVVFLSFSTAKAQDAQVKTIGPGEHIFEQGIIVASDEVLVIKPGAYLKMGENSRLEVNGRIIAEGTPEDPIIFGSVDGYWRGVKINGQGEALKSMDFWRWLRHGDEDKERLFFDRIRGGNIFEHCKFNDISTVDRKLVRENKWKAGIEAYDTAIRVSHSEFNGILHIGGVLAQRSFVLLAGNSFVSNFMHKGINCTDNSVVVAVDNDIRQQRKENQQCNDGIWIIDSAGLVAYNTVIGVGDDGINSDGSHLVIIGNTVDSSIDDGIDISSGGYAFLVDNTVKNVRENGILFSDVSQGILYRNSISHSHEAGLALRNGAKAAANEMDIQYNAVGIRIYQDVPCAISEKDYQKVKEIVSAMKDEDIRKKAIPDISGRRQLLEALGLSYDIKEGRAVLNKHSLEDIRAEWKTLKELFKLVDSSKIEYLADEGSKANPFCGRLRNGLFLTGSRLVNNKIEIEPMHDYCMHLSDIKFSDAGYAKKIEELCEKEYNCPLIDELNSASAVSLRAKSILEKARQIE